MLNNRWLVKHYLEFVYAQGLPNMNYKRKRICKKGKLLEGPEWIF